MRLGVLVLIAFGPVACSQGEAQTRAELDATAADAAGVRDVASPPEACAPSLPRISCDGGGSLADVGLPRCPATLDDARLPDLCAIAYDGVAAPDAPCSGLTFLLFGVGDDFGVTCYFDATTHALVAELQEALGVTRCASGVMDIPCDCIYGTLATHDVCPRAKDAADADSGG